MFFGKYSFQGEFFLLNLDQADLWFCALFYFGHWIRRETLHRALFFNALWAEETEFYLKKKKANLNFKL